jgi:hypothetical protein
MIGGIVACQSSGESSITVPSSPQASENLSNEETESDSINQSESDSEVSKPEVDLVSEEPTNERSGTDIAEIAWQSSPHADAFVLDANGNNNTCARCHAPINWLPSMDDLPESCYACKFQLEDPPPYISEETWVDIPCMVCHEKDKKENIQPEIAWLEIAQLEEYASVSTPTELCLKCHNPINVLKHGFVEVGGAHNGYECTECHDAHDTIASCGDAGCHEGVIEPDVPIPGHDTDHLEVSCVACHDGTGLDVRPTEETGIWTTYVPWSWKTYISENEINEETGTVAYASHNLVIEANCDRCHFEGNTWGLSEDPIGP